MKHAYEEALTWLAAPFVASVILVMAYWDNWQYARFVRRLR